MRRASGVSAAVAQQLANLLDAVSLAVGGELVPSSRPPAQAQRRQRP